MESIIEVQHLSKSYGKKKAINDLSFAVEEGAFFSFLGPNGAGKSTTIDILTTLVQKDTGTVKINGLEIGQNDAEIRSIIGSVFQRGLLDEKLTVLDNLLIRGSFYQLSDKELKNRIDYLSDLIQINEFLSQQYGKLSGGQKRRADIVRALINQPRILFLDEPTAGLDPLSRKILWQTIKDLQKRLSMTVFLTTHYMEEAAQSDKIAIIDQGRLVALDTPDNLRASFSTTSVRLYHPTPQLLPRLLNEHYQAFEENDVILIQNLTYDKILGILADNRNEFDGFEVLRGNMDDVFLNITKQLESTKDKSERKIN
ncbi:ABC transporter ATP-binding protein [Enterococcus mediterraneensis]|uniref:ABC transporter ATP-binding protein n=1 Tax=Enterococcus mediterraneensis TaxID=2364791 RepID=UPI000F069415|nr:ABC transporter ATP-binding protein [Enterococcus mediterraneensis]